MNGGITLNKKIAIPLGVGIVALGVVGFLVFTEISIIETWSYPFGSFELEVFDGDPGPAENYANENLVIRFYVSKGYIAMVGDPDRGIAVDVTNLTRGWDTFRADVLGVESYDQGYVENYGYWTVSDTQNTHVRWHLHVPVTSKGRLENEVTAYLYLWADTDNDEINGYGPEHKPATTLWDIGDSVKVVIWHWEGKLLTTSEENTIYGVNLK